MNSTATVVIFARHNAVLHKCNLNRQFTGLTCFGDAFDPAAVSVDASLETAVWSERGRLIEWLSWAFSWFGMILIQLAA
jgi:hypothetical protein